MMSTFQICRICLRTDSKLKELDRIILDFFKELCDNISADGSKHLCCSICQHLLRKSFNFKKKCQKSNNIFQQWNKNNSKNKPVLSDLYKSIPASSYSTVPFDKCNELCVTALDEDSDVTVKVEIHDYVDDDLLNKHIKNIDEDLLTNGDKKDLVFCGDDYLSDISNDDKCLSDYINESKKKVKRLKSKKVKQKNKEIKIEDLEEDIDGPELVRPTQRRPLKDQKEYETVFNIQLFANETEVKREFAERKTSERYLSAKYTCDICYTVYKCEKLVKFHMRWHDASAGEFPCDVCAMRFKTYMSMRKHKNNVHFGRFQCKKCPLITYHKMVMVLHYRKHQGVSYDCKICGRTYNHSSTYMSHLRKSHPTEHVCVTCAQSFVSEKGLIVHRKKVHNMASKVDTNGTALCEPCGFTFTNQQVYIIHLMKSEKHKDVARTLTACPDCGLEFADKVQVRTHRRLLHPQYNFSAMKRAERGAERGHKCPLCGLSGTHNTWLYRHFQAQHPTECYELRAGSERRNHLCDQCGRSFLNITQLKEHAYTHSGLKPFRCERCPAAFRTKGHLKLHSERHAPPKRECTHCGKKFVSAANLSNHMRSHIGDRRYKCSLCSKGFLHSAALREHVRGVHLHIRRQRKTNDKTTT